MYSLVIVLVILASIFMCGIVLIQESKGGGLASGFSSSNQIMGVRKTTDFLEKATWTLAVVMVVLSVLSAAFVPKTTVEETPITIMNTQPSTDANNMQSFPAAEGQAPTETPAK
ncbi:MAG: preprotein translocase subunit SecG [Bacteroides sp.]|nr:preprotein translocase subunit SecG [Roseburia sp.]MCM1346708.1 preprotein translocase subunit SecG [Bacteroides sp.]MCM1421467.1 preprotein translocase subunit SecG [Bacteroides sp.]